MQAAGVGGRGCVVASWRPQAPDTASPGPAPRTAAPGRQQAPGGLHRPGPRPAPCCGGRTEVRGAAGLACRHCRLPGCRSAFGFPPLQWVIASFPPTSQGGRGHTPRMVTVPWCPLGQGPQAGRPPQLRRPRGDLALPASCLRSVSLTPSPLRGCLPGPETPVPSWKILRVLDHQRPGSRATSVLGRAWLPGIPGVAGSSQGYFGITTNFTPSCEQGVSITRGRDGVTSFPNYRGAAGRGRVRAKRRDPQRPARGPRVLPPARDPRAVTCEQVRAPPPQRGHKATAARAGCESATIRNSRPTFVCLGQGSGM